MPITAGRIKAITKGVDFDYLGDHAHVDYRPAALNGKSLLNIQNIYTRMDAAQKDPDTTEEQAAALMLEMGAWVAEVFASWDYLEDDPELGEVGQPIPITAERIVFEIKRFPAFLTACIVAVTQDYNQGKASGAPSSKNSGATFSQTGRSALRKASRKR